MASLQRNPWILLWGVGYAAVVAGVLGGMFSVRQSVLTDFSTQGARADWQSWREDVKRSEDNPGPVQRKVPKSEEPPALVLMRDYFVVSIFGATFFTSILYWIGAWMVTGALKTSK